MYVGAAVCLWLVRTWKIGEMEAEAAAAGKTEQTVDPLVLASETGGTVPTGFKKSPFLKRLFMWQKV